MKRGKKFQFSFVQEATLPRDTSLQGAGPEPARGVKLCSPTGRGCRGDGRGRRFLWFLF